MSVISEVKTKLVNAKPKTDKNSLLNERKDHPMTGLLSQGVARPVPKIGELIEGIVISSSKNEVLVDIEGLTTGVIRGKEIYDESGEYSKIKPGDKIVATVLEIENESGQMELSFRYAGHQKAWEALEKLQQTQEVVEAKIFDANKGGLMAKVGNVMGFIPVSQLNTEHYPRVEGGDKSKILIALKKFIGQNFKVKIIDVNEIEEKLIFSEKSAWEEKQQQAMYGFKVGDTVDGKITAVVDFGAFVEFGDNLEGLVHISELAWQRIDDPKQIVKVGDKIKAQIISVDGSRVSLSMKKLTADPWKDVAKKYKIGQEVKGKVLKLNPFGAFVELDKDIHGLAHISELGGINHPEELMLEGKTYDFTIISIEPENHRLGLALKGIKQSKASAKTVKKEGDAPSPEQTAGPEKSKNDPNTETPNNPDKPDETVQGEAEKN
ncbi:MAG: RNA binding S1 domain protein [Parcubacteria group bacterium GW2011_GWA2_43_17]|nr:MAG: RNA binding S1 domain protein [Parcubacteria group bacterium GW2011_GWA2_43_17]KKT93793.1 MAG: RNA binding S1 domain protein [Parcubacteria group bacterium GW2011_GWF2_45_11]KKT96640.1 MAG: RNA binding S1 domain protein [Parcubacteria group bacterium GW2011_GWC2_45_15]OGY94479.1 MAG: hypothetical protein A3J95_00245 [Candidatus Komeilibacteria bacterium RIFOXYC2_FULL_45_12]OGY94515.1 MAG: hypothetical protein A2260_00255 [Candidatus Komeilibacteria bacterium RIFOXYA2_FULL_45_9]HAH04731